MAQAASGPGSQQQATSPAASQGSGLIAPPAEERAALAEQFQGSFLRRRRPGRRRLLAGFAFWTLAWVLTLAALSDLSLRLYPEHWCQGFGLGSVLRAVGLPLGVSCEGAHIDVGAAWESRPRGQHWLWETYGFMLRVRLSLKTLVQARKARSKKHVGGVVAGFRVTLYSKPTFNP